MRRIAVAGRLHEAKTTPEGIADGPKDTRNDRDRRPREGASRRGRHTGRLVHDAHLMLDDHVPQEGGRIADGEGRDLGTTVFGRMAMSDETYPLPAHESWLWQASMSARKPEIGAVRRMAAPGALPDLAAGDLLIARHGRSWPDDMFDPSRKKLLLNGHVVAARGLSAPEAATRVADLLGNRMSTLADRSEIEHGAEAARESRKPNEALVILHRSGLAQAYDKGRILAATGGWFFHRDRDDAQEAGIRLRGEEYGLFVLLEGRPWSYGDGVWEDYDSGVDGDLGAGNAGAPG